MALLSPNGAIQLLLLAVMFVRFGTVVPGLPQSGQSEHVSNPQNIGSPRLASVIGESDENLFSNSKANFYSASVGNSGSSVGSHNGTLCSTK